MIDFCHLFGHRRTHLCSSALVAGSISAERRYTAMLDHLERAGQTGTYTCSKKIKKIISAKERVERTSDGSGENFLSSFCCEFTKSVNIMFVFSWDELDKHLITFCYLHCPLWSSTLQFLPRATLNDLQDSLCSDLAPLCYHPMKWGLICFSLEGPSFKGLRHSLTHARAHTHTRTSNHPRKRVNRS